MQKLLLPGPSGDNSFVYAYHKEKYKKQKPFHILFYLRVEWISIQFSSILGIVELLVTSDNPVRGSVGTIPELFLMTANYDTDPVSQLDMMKELQPNKPLMTMEYWAGWFDYWGEAHNSKTLEQFEEVYEAILSYPSSVNIYMFHGGTNFRFLNGASDADASDGNAGKIL